MDQTDETDQTSAIKSRKKRKRKGSIKSREYEEESPHHPTSHTHKHYQTHTPIHSIKQFIPISRRPPKYDLFV